MYTFCFTFLCLFYVSFILPFNPVAGLKELKQHYLNSGGKEKIEAGLQVCDSLADHPEELLRFSLILSEEAEKALPGTLLAARVFRQVSDGYYFNDSLRLSGEFLLKAIRIAEAVLPSDTLFLGSACNDLGIIYLDMGRRREAREFLEQAVEHLKAAGDQEGLADGLSNLGSLNYMEGKYEEAILFYQQAYQIDLKSGNIPRQSSSLNNLGRIYVDWGKYETGLKYYFRSAELLDTLADQQTLSVRYNNIGMVYQLMGRHREAIGWIEKAKAIDEKEGLILRLGTRYFNLANSWQALGDHQQAGECLEKAEQYSRQTGQIPMLTKVHAGLGQHYFNRGNPDLALQHFQKSLEYAEAGGSLSEKANSYKHLYNFYKSRADFKEALRYHELLTETRDSVFNLEVSGKVEELEVQYQTAGKEAEINRLEAENALRLREISFRKRERNWAFGGLALLLLFLAGLYRLFAMVRRQKSILLRQNGELDRLNKTQNRLFSIISHDLRSATAAYQSSARLITHYLTRGEPGKLLPLAPEISNNARVLSGMLENLLQWSLLQMKGLEPEKELVPVKEETRKVVELMKDYATGKSNEIVVEMGDETVWCDAGSFHLILRNLVSNAIKFTSGGKVILRSFRDNGTTILEVEDNGCGMDETTLAGLFESGMKEVHRGTGGERGTGLGLGLVSEHVARNRGSVAAESLPGKGTVIRVNLPSKEQ